MGLEAGWNCHICLRSEHSTDVSSSAQCADISQGYASLVGSVKADSVPDVRVTSRHDARAPRVRCSSAPDGMLTHSANERHCKSVTSEHRHVDDVPAAAAGSWDDEDEDGDDQQALLMMQQIQTEVPLRHGHDRRRRSSSARSASVSSTDRQMHSWLTSRAEHRGITSVIVVNENDN